MFFRRDIEKSLKKYQKFPVIAIVGPRQSGKTTLAKKYFDKHTFVSLEDPSLREFAQSDPNGFLQQYKNKHGIVIDEFQYVPSLLSYIQLIVDSENNPSYFILTGSQNFLTNQAITQSLAGRVGILTLLPFSINELKQNDILENRYTDLIINGGYPRIYSQKLEAAVLYPSYINTYIERDVRLITNVGNLSTFQKFLSLCAGRIGQLLNLSELAMHCGISVPTASKWISILEASYIVFRLQPHFNNFNKRITKSPKLYFYDTGVACNLLRIASAEVLALSLFRDNLFENLIVSDLLKQFYNNGERPALYFWRDRNAKIEVDGIVDMGTHLAPIEIKSGQTITPSFFTAITKWNIFSNTKPENNYIVYGGNTNQKRKNGHVIGWQSAGTLINKIVDAQT